MAGAVQYIWNEAKRSINQATHGIDFTAAYRFEWDTARIDPDTRHKYGEQRFVALGRIGLRIHVLVFTPRGEAVRVISLRKANQREIGRYEKNQSQT